MVPIPDETVAVLRRLKAKAGESVYVFLSLDRLRNIAAQMDQYDGKLPVNYKLVNNLKRTWEAIHADAAARLSQGREKRYQWEPRTLHDLRRSYGTVMAYHVPMHELKSLLGHSTLRTTERYYLAVSDDLANKVQAAFAPAIGAAS